MQVVIIGSGNLATVLAKSLKQQQHVIRQVYSRHMAHAQALAEIVDSTAIDDLSAIIKNADMYFIAVADEAIENVAQQLRLNDKPVFHTAGTVPKHLLQLCSSSYGVFWPMKMLRKQMNDFGALSIFIDANNEKVEAIIRELAMQFTPNVVLANDEMRLKMHLVAALTSNFTNHLYDLSEQYCRQQGISFSLFYGLVEDTAKAIQTNPPASLQAGPAFRGNTSTLQKHRALLQDEVDLLKVYNTLTNSIQQKWANKTVPLTQ